MENIKMENIKAFLLPPVMDETKEVIVTKRAKGEDGNPIPFIIRVIDHETNSKLYKQATRRVKVNGQFTKEVDDDKYRKLLVAACVVSPNFKDAELCAYYKTADPLEVPERMLTAGEYNRLVRAIRVLNELSLEEEDLEDEIKN